ncbi:hypothetical protein N665_0010s0004 [Sinapis alba]|nr:hypothetical protein N665_0010s0004 [Sinapis alba]
MRSGGSHGAVNHPNHSGTINLVVLLILVFEVKIAINALIQGDMEFQTHFGKFRSLWAELDLLRPHVVDPSILSTRREDDNVFGLFLTLNLSYNGLIKHILRADKLHTKDDVFAQI